MIPCEVITSEAIDTVNPGGINNHPWGNHLLGNQHCWSWGGGGRADQWLTLLTWGGLTIACEAITSEAIDTVNPGWGSTIASEAITS